MSIQEQIQIVEDNLNEYGQCNITLEEFNYLKDEIYADGCLAGMELGIADALGEYATMLMNVFSHSCEFYYIGNNHNIEAIEKQYIDDVILKCLEKVKEQNN